MSNPKGKRGFVAPQPATEAVVVGTPFAKRLASYKSALKLLDTGNRPREELTDDELDRIAKVVTDAERSVIETPASTPAEVMEKLNVLHHRWSFAPFDYPLADLTSGNEIKRILALRPHQPVGSLADHAQCLLALYTDMQITFGTMAPQEAEPVSDPYETYAAVVAETLQWEREREAAQDDDVVFPADLRDRRRSAEKAMLAAPSTSWAHLGWKAEALRDLIDDSEYRGSDWKPEEGTTGWVRWWWEVVTRSQTLTTPPAETDPVDAMKMLGAVECISRHMLEDEDGYREWASNSAQIASIASTLDRLQQDARELLRLSSPWAFDAALMAVWHSEQFDRAVASLPNRRSDG